MTTTSTAGLSFSYVYAPEVISLGAILPVVSIAIVAVRIYLRRVQKVAISIDDWLILAALVRCHSLRSSIWSTKSDCPDNLQFMIIGMGVCLLAGKPWSSRVMQQTLLKQVKGAKLGVMGYPTPAPPPSSFSHQSSYVELSVKRFQQVQHRRCPTHTEVRCWKKHRYNLRSKFWCYWHMLSLS